MKACSELSIHWRARDAARLRPVALFLAMGMGLVVNAGCGRVFPPGPTTLFGEIESVPSKLKKDPETNVFIDATMSMSGFVNQGLGPITNYSSLLQALADGQREAGATQYFRLGDDLQAVAPSGENGSIHSYFVSQALQLPFYTSGKTSLETRLELSLTQELGDLTLVVSDLFQQGQAVSELVAAARTQVFRKGHTVGVLAMRSGFNGMVCDVLPPPSTRCFPYVSEDVQEGRPVYLLAFGAQPDVTRLLQTISATLASRGVSEVQTLLVPRTLGVVSFGPPTELVGMSPDSGARPREAAQSVDGFRVRDNAGPVLLGSSRTYSFDAQPLVPEVDFSRVVTRARTVTSDGNVANSSPVSLPLVRATFGERPQNQEQSAALWDVAMNILASPPGKWQAIEFDIAAPSGLAPAGALKLPAWVTSWDLPPLEVQRFLGGQDTATPWNRTLRLRELMEGLYRAAAAEAPTMSLARVFYYLRVE